MIISTVIFHDLRISDREENLKEIIYCHVDINMVDGNERISK